MAKLEADKSRANLNPPEDAAYCESFACTIFERADKVDRAGRSDKNTAMTFYAASIFIEVRSWPSVSHWQDLLPAGVLHSHGMLRRSSDSSGSYRRIWPSAKDTPLGRLPTFGKQSERAGHHNRGLPSQMTTRSCLCRRQVLF